MTKTLLLEFQSILKNISECQKTAAEQLKTKCKSCYREGVAIVCFCIKNDGMLIGGSLKVIKSSEHSILDKDAMETVQNSAPFARPPRGEVEVKIPISFIK